MQAVFTYCKAGFLVMLFLVKVLAIPLAYLDYQLNKTYIATKLCENRYVPQMKCEGNCILMKKIQEANDAPESGSEKGMAKPAAAEFIQELPDIGFHLLYKDTELLKYCSNSNLISFDYGKEIFHPPIAFC